MTSAATILACVLELLSASERNVPVELLEQVPADVSANAEAFVRRGEHRVYLITSTPNFRDAQRASRPCGSREPLLKLASIITHEVWHLEHGGDEQGAYEAQLMALVKLGRGPDTMVYQGVRRSMRTVLQAQKDAAQATKSRIASARRADAAP